MYDVYTGLLRMYSEFRDDGKEVEMVYKQSEELNLLKETYKLGELAGKGQDFDKILSLLNWVTKHIFHKGDYNNQIPNRAMDLFQYSFDKGAEEGINCRSLSFALTECYLAIGMKARTVYLMPLSPYDGDNHVICEVWSQEYNKWIMVDPTYGLYFMDEQETPLNIIEIRERLAFQRELHLNEGCHYNGNEVDKKTILEYYAKDCFYFQINKIQGYDMEQIENNWIITIAPKGYDVKKKILANIDYSIKMWGNHSSLQKWRKDVEEDVLIYKDLTLLQ